MKKTILTIAVAILCLAGTGCGQNAPKEMQDEMKNPVIENIMARRSVRHYTDQTVPRELLQQIAECGVNAPNAMNHQQ